MYTFILNAIHRPELVSEHIGKSAAPGKSEDVSYAEVISESPDIFRLQQKIAHDNGLRTTIG